MHFPLWVTPEQCLNHLQQVSEFKVNYNWIGCFVYCHIWSGGLNNSTVLGERVFKALVCLANICDGHVPE